MNPSELNLKSNIQHLLLTNKNGMYVGIMNYGATVTSVRIPGWGEVTCGFNHPQEYLDPYYQANYPFFGSTIGRYANRIKRGQFYLKGKKQQLNRNEGENHLHGGQVGFDRKVWTLLDHGADWALLTLFSPSGDQGYPGNLEVNLKIEAKDKNQLSFRYEAVSDSATPFSPTNHLYFNLANFREDIRSHSLQIASQRRLEKDETGCATGNILPCEGIYDFSIAKSLADAFGSHEVGLDDYFILDPSKKIAVELSHPNGRKLQVETTEPGLQVYTSWYVTDQLQRNASERFGRHCAICFEPSKYPNGPNIPNSPSSIILPNEQFQSETIFTFI